jgi:hypothetical protein
MTSLKMYFTQSKLVSFTCLPEKRAPPPPYFLWNRGTVMELLFVHAIACAARCRKRLSNCDQLT